MSKYRDHDGWDGDDEDLGYINKWSKSWSPDERQVTYIKNGGYGFPMIVFAFVCGIAWGYLLALNWRQ